MPAIPTCRRLSPRPTNAGLASRGFLLLLATQMGTLNDNMFAVAVPTGTCWRPNRRVAALSWGIFWFCFRTSFYRRHVARDRFSNAALSCGARWPEIVVMLLGMGAVSPPDACSPCCFSWAQAAAAIESNDSGNCGSETCRRTDGYSTIVASATGMVWDQTFDGSGRGLRGMMGS
jgi:hypothetical protein